MENNLHSGFLCVTGAFNLEFHLPATYGCLFFVKQRDGSLEGNNEMLSTSDDDIIDISYPRKLY